MYGATFRRFIRNIPAKISSLPFPGFKNYLCDMLQMNAALFPLKNALFRMTEKMFYSREKLLWLLRSLFNPVLFRSDRAHTFRAAGYVAGWAGERVLSTSSGRCNRLAELPKISTFPSARWLGGIGKNLLDNKLYLW
jgi:hypothetical protein